MTEEEQAVYNNYATPLAGTFLNLPAVPCLLKCPSCGLKASSKVEREIHRTSWYRIIVSRLINCCFCCCCCGHDLRVPCYSLKANHYCNGCSCYFGQQKRIKNISMKQNLENWVAQGKK